MLRTVVIALICLCVVITPARGQGADVEVTLEQFGVGSVFKPGGIVPMRLQLTSNLPEPTSVWVAWLKPNADGDIAEYGRSLTLTPGQPTECWLYAPLVPDDTAATVWAIKVHREQNGIPGEEIGGARISPTMAVGGSLRFDLFTSVLGVVGRERLGLEGFAVPGPRGRPTAAHEETRIVAGILPQDLPDRWYGLAMLEALAWGNANQHSPNVGIDQATAIREYVRRGGHLIITLPEVGNPWGIGATGQNPFEDMLPVQETVREDVSIEELLPVLSKSKTARASIDIDGVNFFGKIGAGYDPLQNNYYEPLIALPDGRIVAIQRTYGHGRITVIGINVSSGGLLSLGLPQADVFWNRILGRRIDAPSLTELNGIGDANRLSRTVPGQNLMGSGNLFVQRIGHEQSASIGVMLAFILFAVYWLVAGLGAYYGPKYYKQEKHSWVAFAAMAGLFTTIAWGAVAAVRPNTITIKHVTFLDQIARSGAHNPDRGDNDPQLQRAISYVSVFLPGYQSTQLEADTKYGDTLMHSWEAPGVTTSKFPDVDNYRIDVGRNFARFTAPSRSTTTRMYLNWVGAVDPTGWGGLLREDPNDPIHAVTLNGRETTIRGSIISELPGELTNVTIFWIKNQRTRPRRFFSSGSEERSWVVRPQSGQMLNLGNTWNPPNHQSVLPGDRIVLGDPPVASSLSTSIKDEYIDPFTGGGIASLNPGATRSLSQNDQRLYFEMLSIFSQLTPPPYLVEPTSQNGEQFTSFYRELARELDLSAWFTRPCLIVMGWMENSPLPIPIQAGNSRVESNGLTLVRWIFPLELHEDIAFEHVGED